MTTRHSLRGEFIEFPSGATVMWVVVDANPTKPPFRLAVGITKDLHIIPEIASGGAIHHIAQERLGRTVAETYDLTKRYLSLNYDGYKLAGFEAWWKTLEHVPDSPAADDALEVLE